MKMITIRKRCRSVLSLEYAVYHKSLCLEDQQIQFPSACHWQEPIAMTTFSYGLLEKCSDP